MNSVLYMRAIVLYNEPPPQCLTISLNRHITKVAETLTLTTDGTGRVLQNPLSTCKSRLEPIQAANFRERAIPVEDFPSVHCCSCSSLQYALLRTLRFLQGCRVRPCNRFMLGRQREGRMQQLGRITRSPHLCRRSRSGIPRVGCERLLKVHT